MLHHLEQLDDVMMMSWHSKLTSQQELMTSHDITMATMVDFYQVGS